MSCYNHKDQVASAHCSYCSKHLCKACCESEDGKIICSDPACKEGIRLYNEINKRSATIYNLGPDKKAAPIPWMGSLFIIFGILIGIYGFFIGGGMDLIFSLLGVFFILVGIVSVLRARKFGWGIG